MGYFYMDWTYLLVLLGAAICGIASIRMRSTFSKYSKRMSTTGMVGAQVAEMMLRENGIFDVRVQHTSGSLTDHYDPKTKTVNLSDTVYNSSSVAAIGVAVHECGHAVQHARNYAPLKARTALVPLANIGSTLAWPVLIFGLFFTRYSSTLWIHIGILLFSVAVLFQIVTLPVEFNASHRGLAYIKERGLVQGRELSDTRSVLVAAALTYVAGALSSILQFLRILLLAERRR